MGPMMPLGMGGGVPYSEPAAITEPAPTPTPVPGMGVPLEQLIKWNYDYKDAPEKRAKIDRAVQMLGPLYGQILDTYGIEHPKTPFEVSIKQNPYREAMNEPGGDTNMRAFQRSGVPQTVFLNDTFFDWGDDGDEPRTVTLGHELVHNMGLSRHDQHPRYKKGMSDVEASQLFTSDVRKIFRDYKKAQRKKEQK